MMFRIQLPWCGVPASVASGMCVRCGTYGSLLGGWLCPWWCWVRPGCGVSFSLVSRIEWLPSGARLAVGVWLGPCLVSSVVPSRLFDFPGSRRCSVWSRLVVPSRLLSGTCLALRVDLSPLVVFPGSHRCNVWSCLAVPSRTCVGTGVDLVRLAVFSGSYRRLLWSCP